MKKYGKHGDYNRITFEKDLEMLLEEKKPDVIFTTSEYDMHGDHSGLYYFVCEVLDILNKKNGYEPKVFCGLIHSCAGMITGLKEIQRYIVVRRGWKKTAIINGKNE